VFPALTEIKNNLAAQRWRRHRRAAGLIKPNAPTLQLAAAVQTAQQYCRALRVIAALMPYEKIHI
jgi:hypothetical protein